MSDNFSFTAGISADAITRVSRMYCGKLSDIFSELYQNSRRGGATRIVVDRIEDPDLGPVIRVADDGPGLADPKLLFTMGDSGWSEETQRSQDSAGMGFFSLAGRHVRITARKAGTDRSWILCASPEAFSGEVPVVGCSGPAGWKGVEILIASSQHEDHASVAGAAARFCPLPVIIDGCEAEREDFLAGAEHVEEWNGVRIGVFDRGPSARDAYVNMNVHGVTLRAPLPDLGQVFGPSLHARIDVFSCAGIKLVLPARKDVVRNSFLETLHEEIYGIFFRLLAKQGHHSLSYQDVMRARRSGVELPDAAPVLRRFAPAGGDRDSCFVNAPTPVGTDALIHVGDDEPVDDQNLAAALDDADLPGLHEPCCAFEGYAWYDRLERLEMIGYRLDHGGRFDQVALGGVPDSSDRPERPERRDRPERPDRPERIHLVGTLTSPTRTRPWQVETDRLVLAPPCAHVDEAVVCITASSQATHADLVDHVTRALFCPSDDYDAGRYEDQLQWFTDEAEDLVIGFLDQPQDVRRHQVERTVRRELWWLLRERADITIHISGGRIDVDGLEAALRMTDA